MRTLPARSPQQDTGSVLRRTVRFNSVSIQGSTVSLIYSSFQASSVIQRGLDVHNLIAITVQGDTINMYVNKSRIDSATSASLATTFSQGHVGLLAYDVSDPTSVIYTNALVWTT